MESIKHILNKHRLEAFVVLFLIVVAVLYFSNGTMAQTPIYTRGETNNPTCGPNDSDCGIAFFETRNEGTPLTTDTLSFDFTGAGVTATNSSGAVTVSIAGGGGGGAFSTTSNVTSNAPGTITTDDFVFGSPTLDDDADSDHFSRFFFDKSLSAFRAGIVTGVEWDHTGTNENRGLGSFAAGGNTIASGGFSFATGVDTTASGYASTAMGNNTVAMGNYSTAIGSNITAQDNYTFGIGLDSVSRSITQLNTMAIMGGNVGIGTSTPNSALQVSGYVQLDLTSGSPTATDCNEVSEEGRMKFDPTADLLYICSGETGWVSK